jgi:polysaccharide biosynthesis protein PslH
MSSKISLSSAASPKPSVLFVSQQCPWPKNSGGNIRTYFIALHLSRIANVTLVTTAPSTGAKQARAALEKFCTAVQFVPDLKDSGRSSVATLARSFLHGRPAFIQHNLSEHLGRAIEGRLAEEVFDWVHVNQIDTYHYVEKYTASPIVLDTHNLHWGYYARRAEHASNPIMSILYGRDARLLKKYETSAFRACAKVLVCSEDERVIIDGLDNTLPVAVVPNGVDCEEHRPGSHDAFDNGAEILFVGDMAYAPNHEGVIEFIQEVLPLVKKEYASVHLTVVGKSPAADLLALVENRADVTVTGFVEEVAPYVDKAKVFVVPLRFGAGTRLKVPQAFASGLPTIATTIGAEGIEYTDGQDIVISDDNASTAKSICALLGDRELYTKLRTNCRRTALDKYDWNVIGELLIEQCNALNNEHHAN